MDGEDAEDGESVMHTRMNLYRRVCSAANCVVWRRSDAVLEEFDPSWAGSSSADGNRSLDTCPDKSYLFSNRTGLFSVAEACTESVVARLHCELFMQAALKDKRLFCLGCIA